MILATLVALLLAVLANPAVADDDDDDDEDDDRDGLLCTDFGVLIEPGEGDDFDPFYLIEDQTLMGDVIVPEATDCTFVNSTIKGDLTVVANPSPETFTGGFVVVGSRVTGDVTVESFSAFVLATPDDPEYDGRQSVVKGDVECNSCLFTDLFSSKVNGDVTLKGDFEGTFIEFNTIKGDVEIVDSFSQPDSAPILLEGNKIKGDVTVDDNQGADPGSIIIADNVIKGDLECEGNSPAPIGGGNTADDKEGQCANL